VRIKPNRQLLSQIVLLVVILAAVGVSASGCGMRSEPRGWSGVAVTEDAVFVSAIGGRLVGLDRSDGNRLWPDSILSESDSKIAVYGTPVLADGLLYVAGYNGRVYAVNADSGISQVVYPRGGNLDEPIVGGVVVSQGVVYFGGGDGKVYALDAITGNTKWPPFETKDKIWSTLVIDGETIYVSSFDKKLYALDANTGSKKWDFEAEGAFVSTPLLYENTIYIGSFDRHVYAVNIADGSLKWRSKVTAEKWFWAKPVAYNGVIYAPSVDGKVYILDAESGREIAGSIDLGSPVSSSPVIVADQVIVASQEGKVYSLDTGTYQKRLIFDVRDWDKDQEVFAPLAAGDGVVYIHARTSKRDTLYAVELETGGTVWPPISLSN